MHHPTVPERYIPPSDFLNAVINEDVEFGEGDPDDANLKHLLKLTRDANAANRDWATLLLAQRQMNRADVLEALVAAASDVETCVRAEAVLGLAQVDKSLASPFLRKELAGPTVSMPLLEAASIVADPSLIEDLEAFAEPSDNPILDGLVIKALRACRPPR
ncbi:lyase [Polymorphobacter arshaanensis]|uniref:Lyase n=1 Tax=Glacieibacterium arshaanense TaxID=2511025 RepID=A0A4Y9EJS1_9SPHN|nr:lyase [Polymorphobacter arshaanensis]TFU00051.1 lyase [Polymorphobacter arshaanensis]